MRTNQIGMAFFGLLAATVAPAMPTYAGSAAWLTFDPSGSGQTMPLSITGNSLIAGWYADNVSFNKHGFVRNRDGSFTTFDAPGSTSDTVAYGVNASGVVTGSYTTFIGAYQYVFAYVRASDGTITAFQPGGLRFSSGMAINGKGDIVGQAQSDSGPPVPFLRTASGKIIMLTVGNGGAAVAINTPGTITGYAYANGGIHGFVRDRDGNVTTFDPPGSTETLPSAINNSGEVTGNFVGSDYVYHGFVREPDGTIATFDAPGGQATRSSTGTSARGIDANGNITGCMMDDNYQMYGFVRDRAGNFHSVTAPDGTATCGTAISPTGKIVGYANNHGFRAFPRVWQRD